jgi:hypothetical protein
MFEPIMVQSTIQMKDCVCTNHRSSIESKYIIFSGLGDVAVVTIGLLLSKILVQAA